MSDGKNKVITKSTEKTVIKALSLCASAMNGSPSAVDVKDGKIIRIRPLRYDSKYTKEEINPFVLKARGKTFEAPMKSTPPHYSFAWKKRIYSPNRIKYPLKRVDWDPNGERNTQNRGKSKYKRISWDEAADIIASEVRRIQKKYGPFAILAQGDGHGQSKLVHFAHSCQRTLLQHLGGFTSQVRNADSWEGWYYGAEHVWGATGTVACKVLRLICSRMSQKILTCLYGGEATLRRHARAFPDTLSVENATGLPNWG